MESRLCLQANHLGVGVYARRLFPVGERILTFRGVEVSGAEAEQSAHTLQISGNGYLDVSPPGRYVNHSCEPNAGISSGNDLIAMRDISPGEEITFDYSTCMMAENRWVMPCECQAMHCRGTIEDFDCLPFDLQNHYFKLGMVSDYVAACLGRQTHHQRLHRLLAAQAIRTVAFPRVAKAKVSKVAK